MGESYDGEDYHAHPVEEPVREDSREYPDDSRPVGRGLLAGIGILITMIAYGLWPGIC